MTGDVGLLLRRAGFGPLPAELAAARQVGYATTLAGLVSPSGPDIGAIGAPMPAIGLDPFVGLPAKPTQEQIDRASVARREQTELLARWWLDRLVVADHQAFERLQFFWQGHWATNVVAQQLMAAQHRTLRESRDFREMAHRMVEDRALIEFLNGDQNTKAAPNENLARELCELFMLGIGQYTERDVKQAARALTGYQISLTSVTPVFRPQLHDAGKKTILGVTANFDAKSLVDLLLKQKACPRFLAARMWFRYASPSVPIPDRVKERMAAAFPRPMAMLGAMFEAEEFQATGGSLVKQPVEWFVGALRQLGLRPSAFTPVMFDRMFWALAALGQRPFAPPSVGGWPSGTAWLTAAAANKKLSIARDLADLLKPERMTPESLAYTLCVDKWTDRTYAVLRGVKDPRRLLALGLVSPEYQVT
ncbi:DUF1800 domain-containing protein [Actinoplanes sp. CA-030573]|uniref:DUF1800 domain-containing protein n=1 Tax=Actinoplanes sp. CA-030573 TaxID=3239898 RepID=UPI003D8AE667